MKISLNGVPVPNQPTLTLLIEDVNPNGETFPQLDIVATGGKLNIFLSHRSITGNVAVHYFGADKSSVFQFPSKE